MSIFVKETQKGFTGESARDRAIIKELIGQTSFTKSGHDAVANKASEKGYVIACSVR